MNINNLLVTINNISVKYGKHTVLSNVSLTLKPGNIITLLGPNGAGKTTLVRVVLGLLIPNSGNVYRNVGLRIGYVPQKLHIDQTLPITVEQFMLLNKRIKKKEIIESLDRVKATHLIKLPLQKLSGGETQRVLLTRAILNKPHLLVLDEPTQGLDVNCQVTLYNIINELCQELNCGILIVSHDLHLVMAKTDEVLCLNKYICCSGTPEIVSQHPEFISMFSPNEMKQLAIYRHDHNK